MAYFVSPSLVAELAMEVEEEGQKFYTNLAWATADTEAKKLFEFLAKQENQHKTTFSMLAHDIANSDKQDEYVIDILSLLRTLIEDLKKTAFDLKKGKKEVDDIEKALKTAIKTEEQSVKIYTAMKKQFTDTFSDILTTIIKQEEYHWQTLMALQADTKKVK